MSGASQLQLFRFQSVKTSNTTGKHSVNSLTFLFLVVILHPDSLYRLSSVLTLTILSLY